MTVSTRRFWSAMNLGGLSWREASVLTWKHINDDAILTRAAAISFYAIAALIPFLGLLIALTAHWLPWIERHVSGEPMTDLIAPARGILPADAATFLSGELKRIQTQTPTGLVSIGLVVALWLCSSAFVEIMDAMNFILGVRETRPYWKRRFVAMVMTLSQAAILIAAVVSIVAWPQIVVFLKLTWSTAIIAAIVHALVVFNAVLLSFALVLYVAPDAEQHWEWITPGSLLGTVVLLMCSVVFRVYAQHWGNYSATYGSLAGIVVLMTWFWLSDVVLLTAAELNNIVRVAALRGKEALVCRDD